MCAMRVRVALVALLLSLCLVAPAQAAPLAPLVIAVGGAWAGAAAASALALTGVLAAAVQIGVATIIGIAGAMLFAPKVPTPEAQQQVITQPVSYQERVYGRVRKGGVTGLHHFARMHFPGWRSVNGYITTVIIAAHEIQGYVEHFLDDKRTDIGFVGSNPNFAISDPFGGGQGVSIIRYRGAPGQVADAFLRDCIAAWTEQHDMAGLAYGIVTARQHRDMGARMYTTGRVPAWAPVVDGNNQIFDPRSGERGFTRNWALCFAHELVEYQGVEVDWDAVALEADVCDQLVTTGAGTLRPRWRVGCVVSDEMDFSSIRSGFATAADAFLFERPDGKFGFFAGRWMEPQVSLGPRDFIALQIGMSRDIDTANEYMTRYIEPANRWKESPSGAWIAEPGGGRSRKEIQAFMVTDHHQACAIAKRAGRSDRAEYRISGTLNFAGFDLIGHRFVSFAHPEMGVSCVLEVQKLTLNADRMTWAFEGVSTVMDDWTLAPHEEPDRPRYDRIDGVVDIETIGSLRVRVARSTSGSAALVAEWDEQEEDYRQKLRYSVAGSEDWQIVDIPSGAQQHIMTGLLDGSTYEVQIRNIRSGEDGEWSAPVSALAVANSDAPPALPRFEVTGGSGQAVVDFDTPNTPLYAAARIFRARNSTNFTNAVLVQTVYGSPNISDGWTDSGLSAANYTYWGRAINQSGVPGPIGNPVTVAVL